MIDGDDSDDSDDSDDDDDVDDDDDDDDDDDEWTRNYINAGWPMSSEDLQRVLFGTASQLSRPFTSEDLFPKQFLMHQQPNPQFTSLEQLKRTSP